MISVSDGIMNANSRLTLRAVPVRSAFTSSKRASSWPVRTNARTTRMPASVSRLTRFRRSILTCIAMNRGIARRVIRPMMSTIRGTITISSPDSGTSWRRAMMTPPTMRMGAETIIDSAVTTTIWTCCTSFVLRVISEAVPNLLTSTCEKVWTARKTALRMSRPTAMAVSAPK